MNRLMKSFFQMLAALCLFMPIAQAQPLIDSDPMTGLFAVSDGLTFSSIFIELEGGKRLFDAVAPIGQKLAIGIKNPTGFIIDNGGNVLPGIGIEIVSAEGKSLAKVHDIFYEQSSVPADMLKSLSANFTASQELGANSFFTIKINIFDKKGPAKAYMEVRLQVIESFEMPNEIETGLRQIDSPGVIVEGYHAKPNSSGFQWDEAKGAAQFISPFGNAIEFHGYTSEMQNTGNIGMKLPYYFQLIDKDGQVAWRKDGETTVTGRGIYVREDYPKALPEGRYLLMGKLGSMANSSVASATSVYLSKTGKEGKKELAGYYASLCDFYSKNGQHAKALVCAENAIQLGESSSQLLHAKGLAYKELGRGKVEAIAFFEKAVALDPNFAEAWLALGYAYKDQGDTQRALQSFIAGAKAAPNDYQAQYQTAWLHNDLEMYAAAIPFLDRAVVLNMERLSQPYNERAFSYKKIGNYAKAALDYEKVTAIEPYNWQAFYNKGYNYIDAGNYDRAIEAFNTALEQNPSSFDTQYELAYSYKAWGKFAESVAAFDKAIEMIGEESDALKGKAYRHKGDCLKELGKAAAACKAYLEAKRLGMEVDEARLKGCE